MKKFLILIAVVASTLVAAAPSDHSPPSAADIALANKNSDERDAKALRLQYEGTPLASMFDGKSEGVSPDIRNVECTPQGKAWTCSYRKFENEGKIYMPCRGNLARSNGAWVFLQKTSFTKRHEDDGNNNPLPSQFDDQLCSNAYRSIDYVAPARRVATPSIADIRKTYRTNFTPHVVQSCKNKVRALACRPVKTDLAQYDCTYHDKNVGEKNWIARQTIFEYNGGWRYSSGDEPRCTIVDWDFGVQPEE